MTARQNDEDLEKVIATFRRIELNYLDGDMLQELTGVFNACNSLHEWSEKKDEPWSPHQEQMLKILSDYNSPSGRLGRFAKGVLNAFPTPLDIFSTTPSDIRFPTLDEMRTSSDLSPAKKLAEAIKAFEEKIVNEHNGANRMASAMRAQKKLKSAVSDNRKTASSMTATTENNQPFLSIVLDKETFLDNFNRRFGLDAPTDLSIMNLGSENTGQKYKIQYPLSSNHSASPVVLDLEVNPGKNITGHYNIPQSASDHDFEKAARVFVVSTMLHCPNPNTEIVIKCSDPKMKRYLDKAMDEYKKGHESNNTNTL